MINKHKLKYNKKTETHYCICSRWKIKSPCIPWTKQPSEQLIKQVNYIIDEFKKHCKNYE